MSGVISFICGPFPLYPGVCILIAKTTVLPHSSVLLPLILPASVITLLTGLNKHAATTEGNREWNREWNRYRVVLLH
jgi:hypothetical protein